MLTYRYTNEKKKRRCGNWPIIELKGKKRGNASHFKERGKNRDGADATSRSTYVIFERTVAFLSS